jgi:hypothetical protein
MVSFSGHKLPPAPAPQDFEDRLRWEETSRRKDILDGLWETQLVQWRNRMLGTARTELMGPPDLSRNFARSLTSGLSSLYLARPTVTHPDGAFPELLGEDVRDDAGNTRRRPGVIESSGLWARMGTIQQYVLGLGEMCFMPTVVGLDEDDPRLVYRVQSPNRMVARAHPEDPAQLVAIRELVPRVRQGSSKPEWTWDEWDISDPAAPAYRAIAITPKGGDGPDISLEVWGRTYTGEDYWWRTAEGRPVLPWVVYHREWAASIWDPFKWREAFDGTLRIAVLWDFWGHCVREASWPQRWMINGKIRPHEVVEGDSTTARHHVTVDPTTVAEVVTDDQNGGTQVGQWTAAASPSELGEAIAADEARLASQMGVDASDLVRTSGDPRSGYALKITNDRRREAQRQYGPQFAHADVQLVAKTALVLNRALGTAYPEAGYSIDYAPVVDAGEGGDSKAQDTALNGAQVTAMQGLLESAAAARIPADAAKAVIRVAFRLTDNEATEIMGSIWNGFEPPADPTQT